MPNKTISAAMIFHDGEKLLVARNTVYHHQGDYKYDLPKGNVDNNDSHIDTVIREFKEEVGIDIRNKINEIISYGVKSYNPYKNLAIFSLKVNNVDAYLPRCHCNSMIDWLVDKGEYIPEIDKYKTVKFKDISLFMRNNMINTITPILQKLWKENHNGEEMDSNKNYFDEMDKIISG